MGFLQQRKDTLQPLLKKMGALLTLKGRSRFGLENLM